MCEPVSYNARMDARFRTLLSLTCLSYFAVAEALAGGLYWTNRSGRSVQSSGFAGGTVVTVFPNAGTNVRGIALDVEQGDIYYCDNGSDTIYRMKLDGTGRQQLLTTGPGSSFPADIRLDLNGGHFYYCDRNRNFIRRCDLDGGNPTAVDRKSVV